MSKPDKQRFSDLLNDLGLIYDKEVSVALKRLYWEDLGAYPIAAIEAACQAHRRDRARTVAAERFFRNPRITMQVVLEAHREAVIERMRPHPLVLVPQDTLLLKDAGHRAGLGPIGSKTTPGPVSLLWLHNSHAFTPDGVPLGVVSAECWACDPAAQQTLREPEARDSGKWLAAYRRLADLAPQVPRTTLVSIGDHDAGLFELFALARDPQSPRLLVRARCPEGVSHAPENERLCPDFQANCHEAAGHPPNNERLSRDFHANWHEAPGHAPEHERLPRVFHANRGRQRQVKTDEERSPLWDPRGGLAVAGRLALHLPRRGAQPARTAELELRFGPVTLKPPGDLQDRTLPLWAVYLREATPPVGVEGLDWLLLTNVATTTLAEAQERLRWYSARWGIKVFHHILKSGCQIEERKLGFVTPLENCLAIDLVVAWRIYYLNMLGRMDP